MAPSLSLGSAPGCSTIFAHEFPFDSSPYRACEASDCNISYCSSPVFRTAHTLKPGGAHLGTMRLAALCTELEEFGWAGQLKEAAKKFAVLEVEFRRVKAALETEREKDRITA